MPYAKPIPKSFEQAWETGVQPPTVGPMDPNGMSDGMGKFYKKKTKLICYSLHQLSDLEAKFQRMSCESRTPIGSGT